MAGTATRHLYLVRHGEAAGEDDDSTLTEAGRRQAQLLRWTGFPPELRV
ncbi:histidine phosphatase family protein [Streptomyces atratus]|jgi:probable phosphoglycerate mutase|uniref:Histidine phosphatase superfamily (Branch 1) n=1 Tax=Streptomyces atratus TaxID=1893 RepID=A0A1K2AUU3_STRAR|nr:Histidine phosphatase superfamily (branch 1) [Streptomyces atratus]